MVPDAITDGSCIWHDDPPWPDMPPDIVVARLAFTPEAMPAGGDTLAVPLPPSLADARTKRRADYVAGRLCARRAMARLTGRDMAAGRSEGGAPIWPEGLTGSISHAAGQAIAIAAHTVRHRSLGVDVESVITASQAEMLAPYILTTGERTRFAQEPPGQLVTLAFSLKEALFKALYPLTGTMFFHEHAELLALEPDGGATLRLLISLAPDWRSGARIAGLWHCSDDHIFSFITTGQK